MRSLVPVSLLLAARLSFACTQPSFEGAPTTAVHQPGKQAVTDLNHDGVPDLVLSEYNNQFLALLLGNGNGTFRIAQELPISNRIAGIATGDFNGDGIPDVAIAHSPQMTIFLGKGDGTVQEKTNFNLPNRAYPIVAADFNGDGKTDLVWAGNQSGNIEYVPGNGDGTFGALQSIAVGANAFGLSAGDFDGDGRIDAAGASYDDRKVVIASAAHTIFTAQVAFQPFVLASADFDRNGRRDLLVAGVGNVVTFFFNKGDGSFEAHDMQLPGAFAGVVLASDFDGDGIADFSIDTFEEGSYWASSFLGNGDGTFRRVARTLMASVRESSDFDRDGRLDMIGSNFDGQIAFYRGRGDGTFFTGAAIPLDYKPLTSGALDPHGIASGDFDGDGRLDIAVSSYSASEIVLRYANGTTAKITLPVQPRGLSSADLDGDGRPDLVALHGNALDVLLNRGSGSFTAPVTYTAPNTIGNFSIADLNGDGKPDLVMTLQAYALGAVFLGTGGGAFAPATTITIAASSSTPSTLVVGDFDRDGKADLVVGDYSTINSGGISFVKGHGDGTFDTPHTTLLSPDVLSIVAFDANRDGILDIAWAPDIRTGIVNGLIVQLGNGDGTFRAMVNIAMNRGALNVATGDWNGDGITDLATSTSADDVVFVLGHGDGTFGDPIAYEAGYQLGQLAVGDINGDGRSDVAVASNGDGAEVITLLYNDCITRRRPARH